MPNKYGQPTTLGRTSRAYSVSRAPAQSAPGAYEAMKMQQGRQEQEDYAARALKYMAALERNKVAGASAPSTSPAVQQPPAFSATGINIVDPQQAAVNPTPAAVAPVPPEDPIEEAYKKYMAQVESNRTANTSDATGIKAAIQGYYQKAAEGNRQTYGGSQSEIDAQAKALGTDFASSREGQIIDATARQRQEQLDSMLAHNTASVDKVAQLQQGVYDAYGQEGTGIRNRSIADRTALELQKQMQLQAIQAEIEAAMMQAQLAASGGGGGGGGGRRGGGRRSSSGSTTIGENAEEVSYVNNIGDVEALNSLSPGAAAQFRRIYNLGGGDVTSALSEGQKLFDLEQARNPGGARNLRNNPLTRGVAPAIRFLETAQKQGNLSNISKAMEALTGISGVLGTPTTRRKVQTTSKSSSKRS